MWLMVSIRLQSNWDHLSVYKNCVLEAHCMYILQIMILVVNQFS